LLSHIVQALKVSRQQACDRDCGLRDRDETWNLWNGDSQKQVSRRVSRLHHCVTNSRLAISGRCRRVAWGNCPPGNVFGALLI